MGATGADITEQSFQCIDKWVVQPFVQDKKSFVQDKKSVVRPKIPVIPHKKQEKPGAFIQKSSQSMQEITDELTSLLKTVKACAKCELHQTRTQIVFGAGDPKSRVVFVGEAPGFDEDKTGKPFVGAAGQLLTKIIHAMHLSRDMVYICNVLKCRPPNNRKPAPDEMNQCIGYLEKQLDIIQPEIICTLGGTASQALLKTQQSITKIRGQFFYYKNIPVMPTFHPSYLLRNESKKRDVWQDMQLIMKKLQSNINP